MQSALKSSRVGSARRSSSTPNLEVAGPGVNHRRNVVKINDSRMSGTPMRPSREVGQSLEPVTSNLKKTGQDFARTVNETGATTLNPSASMSKLIRRNSLIRPQMQVQLKLFQRK